MTAPKRIDPERLAALFDHRLGAAEAVEVRRQLAVADDETIAAYADAVAVARDLSEVQPAPVPFFGARQARRRWLIPAATLAAAAAVAVIIWRPSRTTEYPPSVFAKAIPGGGRSPEDVAWDRTRGASDGIPDRARAVRIGALLLDLEVDAIRGDSTREHADALASVLQAALGGTTVSELITKQPSESRSRLSREFVADVGRRAMSIGDPEMVAVGAYLEAARIATATGDVSFFDKHPPTPLVPLRRDREALDPLTQDALVAFDTLVQARPPDNARLTEAVRRLLRALAQ